MWKLFNFLMKIILKEMFSGKRGLMKAFAIKIAILMSLHMTLSTFASRVQISLKADEYFIGSELLVCPRNGSCSIPT